MAFVGGLLVLLGAAGTVACIRQAADARRPIAILSAIATPVAFLVAIIGGVLVFVPEFLR